MLKGKYSYEYSEEHSKNIFLIFPALYAVIIQAPICETEFKQ